MLYIPSFIPRWPWSPRSGPDHLPSSPYRRPSWPLLLFLPSATRQKTRPQGLRNQCGANFSFKEAARFYFKGPLASQIVIIDFKKTPNSFVRETSPQHHRFFTYFVLLAMDKRHFSTICFTPNALGVFVVRKLNFGLI